MDWGATKCTNPAANVIKLTGNSTQEMYCKYWLNDKSLNSHILPKYINIQYNTKIMYGESWESQDISRDFLKICLCEISIGLRLELKEANAFVNRNEYNF